MALSDNPTRQGQKSTKNKNLYTGTKSWWSDRQKLEAVQTYLMLGNVAMTARVLKIPDDTLRRWYRQAWWKEIEGELKVQDDLQLSARMKKIADKTFDVVEDRLEHGDWVYDQKTGALRRKGVSARDAHKIGIDLLDKREKILNKSGPTATEQGVEEKLATLAEKFASMVNGKITPPTDVVDVEAKETNAVHEEREEGL